MASRLKLTVFFTEHALKEKCENGMSAVDLAASYVDSTKLYYSLKGIAVDVFPPDTKDGAARMTLPFNHSNNSDQDDAVVRGMAHSRYPHGDGRLPVIFTRLNESKRPKLMRSNPDKSPWYVPWPFAEPAKIPLNVLGWVPEKNEVPNWLDFVFINAARYSITGRCLAHEIGHAATLEHRENDMANLMYPADWFSCTGLDNGQLDKIKSAYFTE